MAYFIASLIYNYEFSSVKIFSRQQNFTIFHPDFDQQIQFNIAFSIVSRSHPDWLSREIIYNTRNFSATSEDDEVKLTIFRNSEETIQLVLKTFSFF